MELAIHDPPGSSNQTDKDPHKQQRRGRQVDRLPGPEVGPLIAPPRNVQRVNARRLLEELLAIGRIAAGVFDSQQLHGVVLTNEVDKVFVYFVGSLSVAVNSRNAALRRHALGWDDNDLPALGQDQLAQIVEDVVNFGV